MSFGTGGASISSSVSSLKQHLVPTIDLWTDMLYQVSRTSTEMVVRAVRDHLADCVSSLPALLESENTASLHLYFANLSPLRVELFPALSEAYRSWVSAGELKSLKRVVRAGRQHWQELAHDIVTVYRRHGPDCANPISALIAQRHFG